jgi:glycosyltransferase involved in cell wall biosynthesis
MKYVMVTNIPAPYREPIHEMVSAEFNSEYHVIYAQDREANRNWSFSYGNYSRSFLKKRVIKYKERYIHFNIDVWGELNKYNPEVVITTGFNPTFLLAFLWAKLHRKIHICFTDGWLGSEKGLSLFHKITRKLVYRHSNAFIGASKHSLDLYRHYRCPDEAVFQSHLCANNDHYSRFLTPEKKYDIVFSGQIIDRKLPLFFAEVAKMVSGRIGCCKVLIIGAGAMEQELISTLDEYGIDYRFAGFINQEDLPRYYASSKLLLFPTLSDPWGVVANEACAVGVPVLTCNNAGVANDLVIDNYNGYVLPLRAEIWADHIIELLEDDNLYARFSKNALIKVQEYSYAVAAQGIINAILFTEKCFR